MIDTSGLMDAIFELWLSVSLEGVATGLLEIPDRRSFIRMPGCRVKRQNASTVADADVKMSYFRGWDAMLAKRIGGQFG